MEKILLDVLNLYERSSFLSNLFLRRSLKVIPYQKIESYVPKAGRILDFGCGHGLFTNLIALSSAKREVFGYDIDQGKIKIALNTIGNRGNIHFHQQWEEIAREKLDGITLVSVLYLISKDKQFELLRNLVDLLADEGSIVIVEFDKRPKWKYYLGYLREYIMTSVYTRNEGLFYRSRDEYLSLFRQLGLSVETYPLNMPMYPSIVYACSKRIGPSKTQ